MPRTDRKPGAPTRSALSARSRIDWAIVAMASLVAAFAASADAAPILPSDFGSGAIVESFEGLDPVGDPEVGQEGAWDGVFLPGLSGDYTFGTGVTLTGPNTSVFNGDVFVHDFTSGSPPANGWGANGTVASALDVPFGNAYLGAFEVGGSQAVIELSFAVAVDRVGLYFAGRAGTVLQVDVYSGTTLLESSGPQAAAWIAVWSTSFLGFEQAGIDRVVVTGQDFGIDGLTFETIPPPSTPEPGTALLLGMGLAGLSSRRLRRR